MMTQNPLNAAGSYASVNGLEMYYEVHGGMTTIDDFALVLPFFAQTRQVIAFERQGHGRTAASSATRLPGCSRRRAVARWRTSARESGFIARAISLSSVSCKWKWSR